MPWELEIHNLDVSSSGDSTVIIARHTGEDDDDAPIVRTVLIDAGKSSKNQQGVPRAEAIHQYLLSLGIARVDVMAATHYDNDHYSGLHYLLSRPDTDLYDRAIVYDQGQPPYTDHYYKGKAVKHPDTHEVLYHQPGKKDYLKYLDAINNKPFVRRATMFVNSFNIVHYDAQNRQVHHAQQPRIPAPNWIDAHYYNGVAGDEDDDDRPGDVRPVRNQRALPPDWLVGKEVMWGNGLDGKGGRGNFAAVPPAEDGYPTLTCISANKWVLQADNSTAFVSEKNIYDGPEKADAEGIANIENGFSPDGGGSPNDNAKSLGFILRFNNFSYYIAGDLEEYQEDGTFNVNREDDFKKGVRQYLNPDETMLHRVSAMHCSHHGSNTATSRDFVESLIPSAAFISCSNGNQFEHPHQRTINVLDGYPEEPTNSDPDLNDSQHPDQPAPPPFNSVDHYLTGFSEPDDDLPLEDQTYGGAASMTAGTPDDSVPGHVILKVSEARSLISPTGMRYRAAKSALAKVNQVLAIDLTAQDIHDAADYAAVYGPYQGVANLLDVAPAASAWAITTAAWIGKDARDSYPVELARTAASYQAAFDAIKDLPAMGNVGDGVAEAIAAAAQGRNANFIKAKAMEGGASEKAAEAAGAAGFVMGQLGLGCAGFAAACAIAVVEEAGATGLGQAALVGATIGAMVAGGLADPMAAALYDVATVAGFNHNLVAAASALAAACWWYRDGVGYAVYRALRKAGKTHQVAQDAATEAANAADLTQADSTNDMFEVSFYDEFKARDEAEQQQGDDDDDPDVEEEEVFETNQTIIHTT